MSSPSCMCGKNEWKTTGLCLVAAPQAIYSKCPACSRRAIELEQNNAEVFLITSHPCENGFMEEHVNYINDVVALVMRNILIEMDNARGRMDEAYMQFLNAYFCVPDETSPRQIDEQFHEEKNAMFRLIENLPEYRTPRSVTRLSTLPQLIASLQAFVQDEDGNWRQVDHVESARLPVPEKTKRTC